MKNYLWHIVNQILFLLFSSYSFILFYSKVFLCTHLKKNIWIKVQKFYLVDLFTYQKFCLKFYFKFRECTRSGVRENGLKNGICVVRKVGKWHTCYNIDIISQFKLNTFYDKFSSGVLVHLIKTPKQGR